MVQLKEEKRNTEGFDIWCFNSKMVQLKEHQAIATDHIINKFQFQNGTIKSRYNSDGSSTTAGFQFQNGTIKSRDAESKPVIII